MRDRYNSPNYSRPEGEQIGSRRKQPPPSETNAETFYYKKQMDSRTRMIIVLLDDEEVEGTIEWYDTNALKISRQDEPNLLIYKNNIKYIFKASDRKQK